jgi:hypothetical protein
VLDEEGDLQVVSVESQGDGVLVVLDTQDQVRDGQKIGEVRQQCGGLGLGAEEVEVGVAEGVGNDGGVESRRLG